MTRARRAFKRQPTALQLAHIDAELIGGFLTFVETQRGNGARSRNTRLAAIHSFFKYVAVNEPQLLHHCQQVLAMPSKRYERRTIDYLTHAEIEALIGSADRTCWSGRRDGTLLLLALQTGLRVSEVINLTCGDVELGTGAHVRCMGKGRKERSTPLRKDCVQALRILTPHGAEDFDCPSPDGSHRTPSISARSLAEAFMSREGTRM